MPKRILSGTVTSAKNDQTVTVLVERRFTHPVMKKTIKKTKKYRAHDEANSFKEGDIVRIIECAPKSKTKRWEVLTA
jgi:small subunit ribosomal protein S17